MPQSCPNCRQPVRWLLTTFGERMPVDADPVPGGTIAIDEAGRAVKVAGSPDRRAYVPHYLTCARSYLAPKRKRKAKR